MDDFSYLSNNEKMIKIMLENYFKRYNSSTFVLLGIIIITTFFQQIVQLLFSSQENINFNSLSGSINNNLRLTLIFIFLFHISIQLELLSMIPFESIATAFILVI